MVGLVQEEVLVVVGLLLLWGYLEHLVGLEVVVQIQLVKCVEVVGLELVGRDEEWPDLAYLLCLLVCLLEQGEACQHQETQSGLCCVTTCFFL